MPRLIWEVAAYTKGPSFLSEFLPLNHRPVESEMEELDASKSQVLISIDERSEISSAFVIG
jgi:hypothetical protein